jgi:DNA-binding MarR family transcriptional regulator
MKAAEVRALAAAIERLTLWLRRQSPQVVSSSTITALDRLATEGPLRISDLAAREAMTQPGVTMLVHRMAEAGYAERVPDPTDGRATLVRITSAGRAVLADRLATRAEVLRAHLSQLSDVDQQRLLAALPALERLVVTSAADPTARTSRS